jgi:hypothetical protein
MKAVFGIVSLLLALMVVGVLASRQLKAGSAPVSAGMAASGTAATAPPHEQSRQIQQQVRDDLNRALQQGIAQRDEADK